MISAEAAAVLAPPENADADALLDLALARALARGAAYAEARSEEVVKNVFTFEKGRFARLDAHETSGLAIRVFLTDGSQGFSFTTEWTPRGVEEAVGKAMETAAAAHGSARALPTPEPASARRASLRPAVRRHPAEATPSEKLEAARRAYDAAVAAAPEARVQTMWGEAYGRRVIAHSGGGRVTLHPLHTTVEALVTARGATGGFTGRERHVGCAGLDDYQGEVAPERIGALAARHALEGLRAKKMPAGRFRGIVDGQLGGIIAHETFGHLSEYDAVFIDWSPLRERVGERFAPPGVSIADEGVVADRAPGSGVWVPTDDEATPAGRTVLLEDGVFRRHLHSRPTAKAAATAPTGNGRALDFSHAPIVRMTNTFFEKGDRTREELFEELGDGYYACGAVGGTPQADGAFLFTAFRGYRIERGEIAEPVKGVTLLGNIYEFLHDVEAVADDWRVYSMFFGGCGKWGQMGLPVGVGGPHLLVRNLHFGGHTA